MIRILVNGASGRMGSEAVKAISGDPGMELVAAISRGDYLGEALSRHSPDVALDLTVASVGYENAETIIEHGVYPVMGTSGFTQAHVEALRNKAKEKNVGGIIVPNFAIGAVLMMKFASEAAKYFTSAEILEYHHEKKEEFPSGTALRTAEMIAAGNPKLSQALGSGRGVDHQGIPVHSIRMPGFIAHQEVIFGSQGERLSIRHDSMNRESFMPGVLRACREVVKLDTLVYGLEHVL